MVFKITLMYDKRILFSNEEGYPWLWLSGLNTINLASTGGKWSLR